MIPLSTNHFWFGVVEDNRDPESRGRCRVRIVGVHSEDVNLVPTDELPWAEISLPANNPMLAGRGTSPNGLLPGSCVGGIFADPEDMQQPIIFFAYGGERAPGGDANAGAFNAMGTAIYGDDNNSGCIVADDDPTTPTNNNAAPAAGEATWMSFALQELAKGIRQDKNSDRVYEYSKSSGVNSRTASWCASFVCWCLEQAKFRSPKTGMARGMATSGVLRDVGDLQKIKAGTEIPPYGAIIVIPRGAAPSGHTCFSLGTGGNGRVMCLHGNWGYTKYGTGCVVKDNVKAADILAVRWPSAAAAPDGTAPPQRNYNKDCSNMGDNSSGGETGTPISASGAEKAFIDAMATFGVTNKTERRMLWAQCAHETGGFKSMVELPSAHASSKNQYKGRGLIQITGLGNYKALGKHLEVDLVADPGWITRTVENNIKASLTFWTKPDLGARCRPYAMRGDVDLTSVGINVNPFGITPSNISKVNGLEDRRKWWAKAQTMDI